MDFHMPVLLKEVLELLEPQPGQAVIDGTLGGGGHSFELAKRIEPNGSLTGIDLDPAAIAQAAKIFAAQKFTSKINLARGNYKDIDKFVTAADKILIDIGLSSFDLESSLRGFSFQKDEPLDMRYDPQSEAVVPNKSGLAAVTADKSASSAKGIKAKEPFTAKYILADYSERDLEKIFRMYGEEKFSRKIAKAIVSFRQEKQLQTTTELFELIKKALPAPIRFRAAESARRIFQALRIEVNHELENLEEFLPKAFRILKPGGRLAVISFHSLEDRIVKQFFAGLAKGCVCPPDFPQCACGKNPEAKILTKKPVQASFEEIQKNPRSKPAKLRAIQKI